MAHPTVESIVAGDADAHLATCDSCRQIATMLGLAVPPDAHALPGVDDSVYTEWSPLAEGRGGMGRIFRVLDRRLGRFVAIKQPAPGVGDVARAQLVRRFEREARLTARLQHPAIVGVHEAGRFKNGESFFAMPLLRGAPLSAEIDKRKTLDERLALLPHLTTVAEAVAYAHGEGIVHRDIKPANILIGTFGETVLIDWGLAKSLTDDSADPVMELPATTDGLTQLGVGTPQYMPPEQARGEAPEPGVDIYALGATLYHALAGEPPYGMAKGTAIRRELATSTPRSLLEIEPDVPRELADIVARAMDRDPARRFTSAQALADELRRYQTGQLLTTRRYTFGELVRHFARRHRAALRIGAVALVALIAIAVFAFVRIARERDHAELSETRAQRELRRAQGTIASQQAADPARRLDAIVLGLNAIGPDLRGEPVGEGLQGLVDALTVGPPLAPLAHTGLVKDIQPAGDRLVGVDDARALVVWDAHSGKQLARYPTSFGSPETAHVSPDHQRVTVCGFENHTDVFELATGARSSVETKTNSMCNFLPDGRLVIGAERIAIYDPHTLAVVDSLALAAPTNGLVIGPDFVAVTTLDDLLTIWQPGKAPRSVHVPASIASQIDPEGHTIYLHGADQHVRAVDVATLAITDVWHVNDAHLARDTFSPDGRYLAIGMFDMDNLRRAAIIDRTGVAPTRQIDGMTQEFAANTWVFGEQRVGQLAITDVETGNPILALDAHHDEVGINFIAPYLWSRDRVGPAYVWDLTSSFASGMLLGHSGEIVVVARRGTRLLTASHDGTLRIWSDSRDPIVSARRAEITVAAWLDDARVVVGDAAGSIAVLDAATGKEVAATKTNGPITSLAVDGARIAFGGLDGTLALSDATLANVVRVKSPGPVTAIVLSNGTLASGHDDGSTHLWNAQTGVELASVTDKEPLEEADDHDGHTSLVFSADGSTLYASRPSGHTLVFVTKDLAQRATLDGRLVSTLDGTRIAAAAVDGTVLVHDLAAGTSQKLVGHTQSVLAAAFSDDHRRLATASVDGTVRIWDLAIGKTTLVINPPGLGPATAVTFIGDLVAVGYASGALRLHPTNAASAQRRACWVLSRFDRTRDVDPFCPDSDR